MTVTITSLPALRVAQVRAEVRDTAEIGAAVETLTERAAAAGLTGPAVHTYFGRPDGSVIDVTVGVPVTGSVSGLDALAERGLESYGLHRQVDVAGGVELQCPVRDLGTC
jgi:hypothetical protein